MEESKQKRPVVFAQSAQYKKNMGATEGVKGGDGDDDDEPVIVTGSGSDGAAAVKLSKKNAKKPKKKNRAKAKATVSPTPCPKPSEPTPRDQAAPGEEQVVDSVVYKAGEFSKIRDQYVKDFICSAKEAGTASSRPEALASWSVSLKRAQLLSSLSLPELKKRRFVPKGCTANPFLARVQAVTQIQEQ